MFSVVISYKGLTFPGAIQAELTSTELRLAAIADFEALRVRLPRPVVPDAALATFAVRSGTLSVKLPIAGVIAVPSTGVENEVPPATSQLGSATSTGARQPRSALKPRGTNGNGPNSSGKEEKVRFAARLEDVQLCEATGNMHPTPPRSRRGAQQSAGSVLMQDPEIAAMMSNPGVADALQAMMTSSGPDELQAHLRTHQHNPAVMMVSQKPTTPSPASSATRVALHKPNTVALGVWWCLVCRPL